MPTKSNTPYTSASGLRLSSHLQCSPTQTIKFSSKTQNVIDNPSLFNQTQLKNEYTVDQVIDNSTNNAQIYASFVRSHIENFQQGLPITFLAYGATGTGKTYTLFGSRNERGLIEMSVEQIFSEAKIKIKVSFLEVYNEKVNDLLNGNKRNLDVYTSNGGSVKELTQLSIKSINDLRAVIQFGHERRITAKNTKNDLSSRSHAILKLSVGSKCLTFVDLAGNERAGESLNLDESKHINQSLLCLNKCLVELSSLKKNKFLPIRESKLTTLLKESLTGNNHNVLISCVAAEAEEYDKTNETLRYSAKAKLIRVGKVAKEELEYKLKEIEETQLEMRRKGKSQIKYNLKKEVVNRIEEISTIYRDWESLDDCLSWVFATLKSVARETFLLETKRELVEEQIEETEEMMNDIAAIERANKNYVSHERLEIERDLEGRKKEAEYIRKEIEVTV